MKKIHFLSFLLLIFASFHFAQAQTTSGGDAVFRGISKELRTYDVQHYIIRSKFDRSDKIYFGDVTIQLKPLRNNFNSVLLDAADMKFDSIKLESTGVDLRYVQTGEKLTVNLDKSYSPDDLLSIRLKYSAKPKKGVYFVDAAENHSSQVWTQGEPEEIHHWFPSYDYPDDKATTEQFITVPKNEVAVANGELLETVENADGTKTFHYKMPVVHSVYLTSFSVGKYSRIEDKYKNIPLGYYVYPGRENIGKDAFGKTPDMMRVYESLTGVAFPYNKYDQTIVARFNFGGMENISATTMADTEIFAVSFMPNEIIDLVSHELAHSWFGDLVTCQNWSELWLNEGFATYMEAAYREKVFGRKDYLRKIEEDADRAIAYDLTHRPRHALFNISAVPDDSLFDTTTYQKGGAVIHMLRETVGEANFWKAINIYLNRHKFANVRSTDLKKAMEEVSGMDLNWFFNQWVYKGGFPQISVKQSYNPSAKQLTLTVFQTQQADAVTPSAFMLPLEISVATASGSKIEKLEIKDRTQTFSFKVDGKPSKIYFDPNEKIPLKIVKMISGTPGLNVEK
ncbi:MAG: M1 family metallopeptidase [Pyrinomonadaceae bacterium]